ncbi:MAG: diguanylate cyclase domain-containing protein [Arenimonas sp.]
MQGKAFSLLETYVDFLLDAVCVVDDEGLFVHISAGGERVFGYRPEEMVGKPMIGFVHPDDRERTLQVADEVVHGAEKIGFENRYVRKDGDIAYLSWSARWSESERLRVAVARDVGERRLGSLRQAAVYAISEAAHGEGDPDALFAKVVGILNDLMPTVRICIALYEEDSGEIRFPVAPDAGDDAHDAEVLAHCRAVAAAGKPMLAALGDGGLECLGIPLKSENRTIGMLMAGSAGFRPHETELLEFVSVQVAAAIERRQLLQRLRHLALHDALTRLPNRELFHDRIRRALYRNRRDSGALALLYIDLDGFKQVNDGFGHAGGDALLQHVGRRILRSVRESDTVARFGGDEFVVLLEDIESAQWAQGVADSILDALSRPFELMGRPVGISASIGIALSPEHGDDEKQLLRRADEAMYAAKHGGGGRVHR